MKYTIKPNTEFKSIEIEFDEKPSENVREALKGLRYRWHNVKKVWYGYSTEEIVRKAIENAETGKKAEKPAKKAITENEFGVKVGDIFSASWGYEQTNVNFFQVVALCGTKSVRVREVVPEIVKRDDSGFMSSNHTYRITNDLLPAKEYQHFITDKVNGDMKRLNGNKEHPYFNVSTFAIATKMAPGDHEMYESWYA